MFSSTPLKNSVLPLLGLIAVGLALTGCEASVSSTDPAAAAETAGNTTKPEEPAAPAIPVEVAVARQGDISAWYTGTATLEARYEADAIAKVAGVVEEILVEEGETVEKGQPLARLADERLKLELARARANMAQLEQEFTRSKQLHARNLISTAEFERQKYEIAALRAAMQLAELQHAWTTLRAPISGVISARFIKAGNMIEANQKAFHIVDMTPLIAQVHVPETELASLHTGQSATISPQAAPAQQFDAHVERVSPVVDADTGTFKITLRLNESVNNADNLLRPGMFVTTRIEQAVHKNTVLIPRGALFDDNSLQAGQQAIFVARDGVAHLQAVTPGFSSGNHVEILSGLTAGTKVITVGQNSLRDGASIALIQAEPIKPDTKETAAGSLAAAQN
ncbi:MAG TPA: efflux RND transporter periplasmic adaptor subunit [Gammaproteobacteria bacterium]|nr:efflux RND transporter periplasmic adaptor subunit [Gammaproteobacteria bacterium]